MGQGLGRMGQGSHPGALGLEAKRVRLGPEAALPQHPHAAGVGGSEPRDAATPAAGSRPAPLEASRPSPVRGWWRFMSFFC